MNGCTFFHRFIPCMCVAVMTVIHPPADPVLVLETLLPHLRAGAEYALRIQNRIAHQPDKAGGNQFAAALSDADISIQTAIEVAVLSAFPDARFHGEEYASSVNTKYLAGTWWDEGSDEWVFLLDPIDGTRYYLDQGEFQVIFSIASPQRYEASIFLFPRRRKIIYAVHGGGAFIADWSVSSLRLAQPLRLSPVVAPVYISRTPYRDDAQLSAYGVFQLNRDYRPGPDTPIYAGFFFGDFSAIVMSSGQLIDGAAAAFVASEAGAIVTNHRGEPMPPPRSAGPDRAIEGLVISLDRSVHNRILAELGKEA